MANEIEIVVKARDETSKALSSVSSKSKSLQGRLQGVSNTAGKVLGKSMKVAGIGALAAGAAIGKLGFDSLQAAEAAATSNDRILQINKSMGLFGNQAGAVSKRLVDLADKTARMTGVDQNSIKATQAKLLTFKEIAKTADQAGGAFDRANMAAIDMAAAGFGSAETNAVQLGKALNDPITGITALTRSGITFTEAEKEKIKTWQESGKVGQAQAYILKAIEKQVGGTAEKTANATDKMKVVWSQLKERLGSALLPVVSDLAASMEKNLLPAAEKAGKWLADNLPKAIDAVKEKFEEWRPILETVARFIGDNWKIILKLVAAFYVVVAVLAVVNKVMMAYQGVMMVVRGAMIAFRTAQIALNIAMMANPVGLVIAAIVGLVAIIVIAYKKNETFRKIVQKVWSAVKKAVGFAVKIIVGYFKLLWAGLKWAWEKIKTGAMWIWNRVVWLKERIVSGFTVIKQKIKAIFGSVVDWVKDKLGNMVDKFRTIKDKIKSAFSGVKDAISAPFKAAFNAVRDFWNSTIGGKGFTTPSWIPGIGGKSFTIPRFASGGIASGMALVGERGPELVNLPSGSKVIPSGQSRQKMGAGGRAQKVVLEINSSGTPMDDFLVNTLRKAIRVRGGDVQIVLGK